MPAPCVRPPHSRRALVRAALLAAPFLLLAAGSAAAEAPGAAGHWEGAIQIPGQELGVIVDLAPDQDGAWTGEIDIPLQGAKDLALADVTVQGNEVGFSIAGIPGTPTFQGTLSADGQSIAGQFVQAGANFPFKLVRKGDAALAGRKSPEELLAGFDAFVEAQMKEWKVPGVAVAIVKDGRVVLERGYGQRDTKAGLPVDANTLFAIGSSTKAFTALGLAILVDEGKLEWDKPVVNYLPDFQLQDETATKLMTPRDLTTHRSGLPRHDLMWYGSGFTREEMYGRLQYLQPSASVRNRFQYQNLMYMTAGILAGKLSGASWETFTRERILVPLGMESTVFSVPDAAKTGNVSKPYEVKKETEELAEMAYRDIQALGPAGTIFSSVHDMAQWLKFQLGDGTLDGTAIVSATQLAETHKPQMVGETPFVFAEKPIVLYGLGWFVQPYRGHARIHHGGNIDGFSAMVSLMPEEGAGAVILTNLNGTPLSMILADAIHDRFLELEPIDWSARFKARREQGKAMEKESVKAQAGERRAGTRPSHPLADYAAEYEHPAYGVLTITASGRPEALAMSYNGFKPLLEHWHYDVFRVTDSELKGALIAFGGNLKGDIETVTVPLETSVDPIVFTRKPPASMNEAAFLDRFVGEYSLGPQTITVARRGSALVASIPGQPTYELVPYKGTEFNLKGMKGFSVRFVEKDGKATGATFIQPDGVYEAKRK
ncbi:MAG: serine hydrolase [Acidobacteria bacterium]|jgi:CubicO group peptidase (beta-lactamase class C family)|nr:serine hydrolase [Acidobacteriota bacterium]